MKMKNHSKLHTIHVQALLEVEKKMCISLMNLLLLNMVSDYSLVVEKKIELCCVHLCELEICKYVLMTPAFE